MDMSSVGVWVFVVELSYRVRWRKAESWSRVDCCIGRWVDVVEKDYMQREGKVA